MTRTKFLGLDFVPISLNHQGKIEGFFKKSPQKIFYYTFTALLTWSSNYCFEWVCLSPDTLLISLYIKSLNQRHLLQPIGVFSVAEQQMVLQAMALSDYPIKIFFVSDQFIAQHVGFCSLFDDQIKRDFANYIYRSVDLATLAGRRYAKKRNLIAQAESAHQWTLQPLTQGLFADCLHFLEGMKYKQELESSVTLEQELKVINTLFPYFTQLNQKGFVIKIADQIVAFSIYEELNPSMAVLSFEKADRRFKGLYQLINRETAKAILRDGYLLINREDDIGIEGLRQAKMSYFPFELVASHLLTHFLVKPLVREVD